MTDKPVSRKVAIKPATGQRRQVDHASELNPEQLAVVMHAGGPMLVLAGAGSGKTRTVAYRVARLLEDGVEPGAVSDSLRFVGSISKAPTLSMGDDGVIDHQKPPFLFEVL